MRTLRLLAFIQKLLDRLTGVTGALVGWLVLPLVGVTVYEVIARHVFNAPTIWTYELGYMLTGSYFMLGFAYALRENAHIRIDVLYNRFSKSGKAVADLVAFALIALPTVALIAWPLFGYAHEAYESGEQSGQTAWNPVLWPFRAMFFLGFALLVIQCTAQVIRSLLALFGHPRTER